MAVHCGLNSVWGGKIVNTNGEDAELSSLPKWDVVDVGDRQVLIAGLCTGDKSIYSEYRQSSSILFPSFFWAAPRTPPHRCPARDSKREGCGSPVVECREPAKVRVSSLGDRSHCGRGKGMPNNASFPGFLPDGLEERVRDGRGKSRTRLLVGWVTVRWVLWRFQCHAWDII